MLNWALDGLDRLRGRDFVFHEPDAAREARELHRQESNPALRYLNEYVGEDPDGVEGSEALYRSYRSWAEAHGHAPLAEVKFAREVKRRFPQTTKTRRLIRGYRAMAWAGIRKTAHRPEDEIREQLEDQQAAQVFRGVA
jgi:phage/plasmid-associated DNA primase